MRSSWSRLATLLALIVISTLPGAGRASEAKEILSILEKERSVRGLNAVICGVWRNGKPIVEVALGNSMVGVPATTRMHYRVGGVTYTCVATLLLIFADQGKLRLSDPVSKWFPDLPDAKNVTLAMLANCTSGYADYVLYKPFVDDYVRDPFQQFSSADLLRYAFATPKLYEPGKGWNYSHTNFVILGDILAKVGKQPLRVLLDRYIFKPLRLRSTYVPTNSLIREPALHAYTHDRGVYEDSTAWNPSWTREAGMLVSNVRDLGVLAQALGTGRFLSRKSFETQIAPTNVGLGGNRASMYYGYGVIMLNGWLAQNPNLCGYSTMFGYLPAKKLAITITTTKGPKSDPDGGADSPPIFRAIVELLAPGNPIPASLN